MRILTLSDKVEPVLYGPYIRERVGKPDLILACGDLPDHYLEYIVGLLDAPLFYVHGNHDRVPESPMVSEVVAGPAPLAWATDLHGRTLNYEGLLIAGLEGCRVYNPGAPFQYTESEVRAQVLGLELRLCLNRLRYGRYLDILITHAPPRGIHDAQDLPHQGFESYLSLLRRSRPTLMIHGHHHVYKRGDVTESDYAGTRIINTYGYRVLELTKRPDGKGWALLQGSR